ncbi:YcxB family protein [Croceicoccus naphthovorans]|uniref:YcxB-like C-terminal domain-containing protein n=1 Tax=Croceicoccus naphthovorans TaxID=1348774 RepID=A0A0G3XJ84_9SPHN|nr:YcxB family protein [Croceicoccus naphthovorans]AKM10448.1 hypothetical protein AB433_11530 [Croceicoccus naphthovorans]MBB3988618.1 hypothetical protein [Croceicoccus naphthovorans]
MTETGPFTYRVTEAEAVAAARKVMRKRLFRPPTVWLIVAIVVVAVLLLILDAMDGYLNVASTAALLVALPALWLTLMWLVPRQARRQFRQSAALRDESMLSFDDEALTFVSRRGTVRMPFAEFLEVSVTDDLILLHQTEMFYNLVPRHALGDAAKVLLSRLEAAGVRRL